MTDFINEKISGIFSMQEVRKIGTGVTVRKSIHKSFWFCNEISSEFIEVQPINQNYIPSGPKRSVEKEKFLVSFSPEPEFYLANVFPKLKEVNKLVARGERYQRNKEYYSAEMEFNNALKIDEENVKANFGLGLTYMARGDIDKANDILKRIVKLDAAFEAQHKHLFNEFGIQLRKNKMYSQSVDYYSRALELTTNDENLYYNIARAFYENANYDECAVSILNGLKINQGLVELSEMLTFVIKKQVLSDSVKAKAEESLKAAQDFIQANPDKVVSYHDNLGKE